MLRDLKFAFRRILKNPGFSAVAILSLALGIGANTAIFSVINGVLLRSLPYRDPDRIVMLLHIDKQGVTETFSPRNFEDYTRQSGVFESAAAMSLETYNVTGKGDPQHAKGTAVTWNFFQTLGVNPKIGRSFRDEESRMGAEKVVILSENFWRENFAAGRTIIGKNIDLDGVPHTIVGIAPRSFDFPKGTQVWRPLVFSAHEVDPSQRGARWVQVIARLKSGVLLPQAQKQIQAFASRMAVNYPRTEATVSATVMQLQDVMVKSVRPALLILFAAVGLVLLIACANVTNLLLSQNSSREAEVAVRTALGANLGRMIRQFLTETILLTVAAAVIGMFIASWGRDLLIAFAPTEIPRLEEVKIDYAVFVFALLAGLLSGLLVGIIPAIQASRKEITSMLKQASAAGGISSGNRIRRGIVISEVALAVVLLVTAGLLIKSFIQLQHVRPGFGPAQVTTFNVSLPDSTYPETGKISQFFQKYIETVASRPGVVSAGAIFGLPLSGGFAAHSSFQIIGRPEPPPDEEPGGGFRVCTPAYFQAMKIPLIQGRAFQATDTDNSEPVVIINQTAARRYWPNQNPIGQHIKVAVGLTDQVQKPRLVVGIVGDVHFDDLESEPEPEFYISHTQQSVNFMTVVVRSAMPFAATASMLRKDLTTLDPALPAWNMQTMDEIIGSSIAKRRFVMLLLVLFACLALVLAALGIYGVLSYSVSQRTREIGLRMALGAANRDLLRMMLREALLPVGVGLTAGLLISLSVSKILSHQLFHVSPTDGSTLSLVIIVLFAVALVASYLPAHRAVSVDPMRVLRYE